VVIAYHFDVELEMTEEEAQLFPPPAKPLRLPCASSCVLLANGRVEGGRGGGARERRAERCGGARERCGAAGLRETRGRDCGAAGTWGLNLGLLVSGPNKIERLVKSKQASTWPSLRTPL